MKIAVLASGFGSTLESLIKANQENRIRSQISAVFCDRPARALDLAKEYGISGHLISPKDFGDLSQWDEALATALRKASPDLVILAGFLRKIGPQTLKCFGDRMINSHPSLLPKYGGHGMYGRKVHEAVLANREKETGISIHLVNPHYDEGAVLAQRHVPIESGDTAETLEARAKAIEKTFLLEFIAEVESGKRSLKTIR